MPRKETILNIFVASPSDVSEERKALQSVVHELNKTWSKKLNLRLDLIRWETDTYPGVSSYPQEAINNQINDEYDIFIAIFWSKIGTITAKAESGTVEEFERAYKKYLMDSNSVDIMLYFKDQPIPPSKMDPEQLKKLNTLKSELGPKGALYWTFETIEDFEPLLRAHLSRVAQKWATAIGAETKEPSILAEHYKALATHITHNDPEEDEYGIFDYLDIFEDRIAIMTLSIETIGEATTIIGEQFARKASELDSESISGSNSPTQRKIIKLSSLDLDRYAETIESQAPILSRSREDAFEALSKAVSLHVDFETFDSGELGELRQSLIQMTISVNENRESIISFMTALSSLPRLTIELNKSKRRATKALNTIINETDKTGQSANEILKLINTYNPSH